MEIAQVRGILSKVDPTPLFFLLVFRVIDLLSTRVALLIIPGTYEGMILGNNLVLSLGFVILPFIIQLLGIWKREAYRIAIIGNWVIVIFSIFPIINNLIVLRGA